MKRLFLGLAGLALATGAANAQATHEYTTQGSCTIQSAPFTVADNKCVVANELCFLIRANAGGQTATERTNRLNERLAYILGYERLAPGNIYSQRAGANRDVYVGRSLLFTFTPCDAVAAGVSLDTFTENAVSNLKHALPQARPPA